MHVCQRWRLVIFDSPLRLNLRLLCTHGTSVQKNLDIWPTFPLIIEYFLRQTIEGFDEANIVAALEHPDRVRSVRLSLTGPALERISMAMQEPFPALTHLVLLSGGSYSPVIPGGFMGRSTPRLQKIELDHIPIPSLPALLLSTGDLVTLHLLNIPQAGYIPPEAIVAALATLTRLEDLRIEFQSPASRPDRIRLPPVTRTVLPALTAFAFRGAREYLEDFVARIDAPQLHTIFIDYFNQVFGFEISQLWHFIHRSEDLTGSMRCFVEFQRNFVTFAAGPTSYIPEFFDDFPRHIVVRILCEGIDRQVSHIGRALNQISAVRSNLIHFAIGYNSISPGIEEGMDDVEWLQPLRPLSSLQTLFVSKKFSGHLSRALEDTIGVMATEVLPALDMLCLEGQPASSVHKFISARSESGRPVTTVDTKWALMERLRLYVN